MTDPAAREKGRSCYLSVDLSIYEMVADGLMESEVCEDPVSVGLRARLAAAEAVVGAARQVSGEGWWMWPLREALEKYVATLAVGGGGATPETPQPPDRAGPG
jgi:hypothetical protein